MSAITENKRTVGMAALVTVSLLAGFFVATTATGQAFATVGTVAEDNQAYQLPLEEDQRLRFTLDAEDGAQSPDARFAVYDPQDRFFGYFDLAGDGDDVEMIADQEGAWVVFVTHASGGDLAVQFTEDKNASEDLLQSIEVDEHRIDVTEQSGGALDDEFALRLQTRPAVAFLEFEGNVTDLDATVSSEEGVVYEIEDGQANRTDDGAVHREGQTTLTPGNLAAGTYKVHASADNFDGSLDLVYQTYDRLETHSQNTSEEVEAESPLEDASVVAEAESHEAYEVPTQGADELMFAVHRDAHARILVYNASDDVEHVVEIEGDHGYDRWQGHEDDDSEDNRSERTPIKTVSVNATDETHVVFVQHVSGSEDTVLIALPGLSDATPATALDLEAQEVTFDHAENQSQTAEVNLTHGLVGLSIESHDVASFERSLSVTGPLGEIAVVDERASTFGWSFYEQHHVEEENFSDGLMQLNFEQDSLLGQGETTVTLHHYVR